MTGKETAYLDYYNDKNIIPVSQPISSAHFHRRNYLYSTLGINLSSLRNSRVLEFGPGGGFNAQATSKWMPAQYVLVDASNASLDTLRTKLSNGEFASSAVCPDSIQIVDSSILSFHTDQLFDLVIAEGLLSAQTHPHEILEHATSFTEKGGVFITSTVSACSVLSETCRKMFLPYIEQVAPHFDEQVAVAEKIFAPHLNALGSGLRPARDWVLDNILHKMSPENQYVFTLSDVITSLDKAFEFHGSSPRFCIDDRFYKKVTDSRYGINSLVLDQMPYIEVSLLDYRVPLTSVIGLDSGICREIDEYCREAWKIQLKTIADSSYAHLDDYLSTLKSISLLLPLGFQSTKDSIDDFIRVFPHYIDKSRSHSFSSFQSWWGRGQQYISLIRRPF